MPEQKLKQGGAAVVPRAGSTLLIIGVLLILFVNPVFAQTYLFSVLESTTDVYVNEDGTVSIDYYYLFQNAPSADPIDIVDIGLPTASYSLDSVSATIDGQPVQLIAESQYVDPGVEIHLGQYAIQPGDTGELRVRIGQVNRMLFRTDKVERDEAYGSFQFQPNFFGSDFVTGQTRMTVTLHLPPGMEDTEPVYFTPQSWPGSDEPQSGFDEQDRVYYRWTADNTNISRTYVFGAAFPARLVPESALLVETPFSISSEAICPIIFCLGFGGFMIITIYTAVTGQRKRRLQYLPPKVSVEGNGIKRGLTAIEAAIIMQQPMDKILTMILFSVIKKGAASVVSRDPMKLEIAQALPEGLRPYEVQFLQAMDKEQSAAQRSGLQDLMTQLVRSVSEKMRGFSLKETVAYYQDIMNKAWQQVTQAQTPELKMQSFDEAMDWTMLDRRFEDRTQEVFGPRPVIVPVWWGRYDPTFARGTTAAGPAPARPSIPTAGNRPPGGISLPSLPGGEFAASMVGGIQSFSSNVVGDLTSFTGGVTEKTNPVPKSTSTSGGRSGGGGGRSCACACACAGCACACAGGGR